LKWHVKHAAGKFLSASRLYGSCLRAKGIVVLFHRVDSRLAGNPLCCSEAEFRMWCTFFKDHFNVVRLEDFVGRLRQGAPIGDQLCITFDDGYLDNYTAAAPELSRQDLPATFFVATDFIGSSTVPWWDAKLPIRPEWMSWDHVRELRAAGFEIGAHTMNHVHMGQVAEAEAEREVLGSRARLEAELGEPPEHFAYPYGSRGHINAANHRVIRRAGFSSCCSAYGGLVSEGDDPLAIQRLPISPWYRSPSQFLTELVVEAFRPSHAPERFAA
jgi:hypothetical protein